MNTWTSMKTATNRRSFVKDGLSAVGVATVGAGLLAQAVEIEALRRHFGFPERELALNLGLSDRAS